MTLEVNDRDGVRTLTISNPGKKNALDDETLATLRDTLIGTGYEKEVRVVVLTGEGGDFSSGADVSGLASGEKHPYYIMRIVGEVADALHDLPQPVIAKVRGVAVGAACNLAIGCDLVAADTTARFCEIFAKRGLSVDGGGSWLLPQVVGMRQAKRLALLGDMVGAQEALELGMLTWLKEPGELDAFVDDVAARLASGPPLGLAGTKALLQQAATSTFHEALAAESAWQITNFATDGPVAFEAFAKKQEPTFRGEFQGMKGLGS
jgi:2-(1,2-epoxy-1,2-dihydrophenyl)acetyl-CoA isomerase